MYSLLLVRSQRSHTGSCTQKKTRVRGVEKERRACNNRSQIFIAILETAGNRKAIKLSPETRNVSATFQYNTLIQMCQLH